jgi:protein Mpv17
MKYFWTRLWSRYTKQLSKRPLLTKAVTAATLMSASDLTSQSFESAVPTTRTGSSGGKLIDYRRTLNVGITGLTFTGPLTHAWYALLSGLPTATTLKSHVTKQSFLAKAFGGSGAMTTLGTKLLLDAIVFSPVAVGGYFVWRSILEGAHLQGMCSKLHSNWGPALKSSWSFWPLANIM